MDTSENIRNEAPEDVIVLGTASVETHGDMTGVDEILGAFPISGISED